MAPRLKDKPQTDGQQLILSPSPEPPAAPRSIEYLYAATRQEIARYSNLDWAVMAQAFALLTGILLLPRQDKLLGNLFAQITLYSLEVVVVAFFIYTRIFIHNRLTQERELQRQIESHWKSLGHFSFVQGRDTLHCDRFDSRISSWHRPIFALAQCTMLIIYALYIAISIFRAGLPPITP